MLAETVNWWWDPFERFSCTDSWRQKIFEDRSQDIVLEEL